MIYQITLTHKTTSEVLTLNPENWSKMGGTFERSPIYKGFIRREFKGSLRFPILNGGGGQFILDAYEDEGLEAVIYITIKRRNPNTCGYDNWYSGILELKPDVFFRDPYNRFVECPIIDGAKQNKFITRDQINYNVFSLVSSDNVTMPDFTTPYREINYTPIDIITQNISTGNLDGSFTLTTSFDVDYIYYTPTGVSLNEFASRSEITIGEENAIIYTNQTASEVKLYIENIVFTIDFTTVFTNFIDYDTRPGAISSFSTDHGIIMEVFDSENNYIERIYFRNLRTGSGVVYGDPDPSTINASYVDTDFNNWRKTTESLLTTVGDIVTKSDAYLSVPVNGYVQFSVFCDLGRGREYIESVDFTSNVNISELHLKEVSIGQPNSTVKGMFAHEAITRLIQLSTSELNKQKLYQSPITGGITSEFTKESIDGVAKNHFITNGKLIRQYPNEPLNLNIREVFLTLYGLECVGMAYDVANERFYIDDMEKFFNTSFLFDLGEVAELIITPYEGAYFSQILSGTRENLEYEEVNGANEYNVNTEHSTTLPIKEVHDITTPLRTDSVPQELARRYPYSENASTDTKYDDKIFITDTDGTSTKQNGTSVTGFEGVEDYYNIRFTPRNCVIRHTNFITPQLWRSSNQFIKFVKNLKNVNLSYTAESGYNVTENEDIKKREFKAKRFNPEQVEFDRPVNEDIVEILNNDPHGLITFNHLGENYAMFLLSLDSEDYRKGGKWKGVLVDYDAVVTALAYWENDAVRIFENGNEMIWES